MSVRVRVMPCYSALEKSRETAESSWEASATVGEFTGSADTADLQARIRGCGIYRTPHHHGHHHRFEGRFPSPTGVSCCTSSIGIPIDSVTLDDMAPLVQTPSFPELVEVDVREGSFLSSLLARRDFSAGERLATLTQCVFGKPKRYTSVQYREDGHFELCSEFVYMNHSCDPSAALDVNEREDIHVRALREIKAGEAVTFFYPSTEWDMDQPFDCTCGASNCLGRISGAKQLSVDQLKERGFVNNHILTMKRQGQ